MMHIKYLVWLLHKQSILNKKIFLLVPVNSLFFKLQFTTILMTYLFQSFSSIRPRLRATFLKEITIRSCTKLILITIKDIPIKI